MRNHHCNPFDNYQLLSRDNVSKIAASFKESISIPFVCGDNNYQARINRFILSDMYLKFDMYDYETIWNSHIELKIDDTILCKMQFSTAYLLAPMMHAPIIKDNEYILIPLTCITMIFGTFKIPIDLQLLTLNIILDNPLADPIDPHIYAIKHQSDYEPTLHDIEWSGYQVQEIVLVDDLIDNCIQIHSELRHIVPYVLVVIDDPLAKLLSMQITISDLTPHIIEQVDITDIGVSNGKHTFGISLCPEALDDPRKLFDRNETTGHGNNFSATEPITLGLEFGNLNHDHQFIITIIAINHMVFRISHDMMYPVYNSYT
jgi:hypothetical protein